MRKDRPKLYFCTSSNATYAATNPRPDRMSRPPPQDAPRSPNMPNFSKTRQQRAAQQSEEVRALARDAPTTKVGGSESTYRTIRSKSVDAEAVGRSPRDASRGMSATMGQNDDSGREGPGAQSPGRQARAPFGDVDEARQDREPGGAVLAPSDGGEALVKGFNNASGDVSRRFDSNAMIDEDEDEDDDEDEDGDDDDDEDYEGEARAYTAQHELALLEQFDKEDVTEVPFEHDTMTKEEFLRLGQGGATIAGGNSEGVIEDRLKQLSEATQDGFRNVPDIAAKMMKGGSVNFKDEAEKEAVVAAAEAYAENRRQAFATRFGDDATKREFQFGPLAIQQQDSIVNKMVRGKYQDVNATSHKHDILNHIARATLRNGTYLDGDGSRFLQKVQSLLPAQTSGKPQQRQVRR